jgi:hypothetical protein
MNLTDFSVQSTAPDPSNFYLAGADNHNLGNTGGSWYDPTTWGTRLENAGKFLAVSALSGADSIYNSAVTGYNYLGGEAKLSNTSQWITAIDEDLGSYYSQNRESADMAGFIGSSLIPGMAGVKILGAGQKALQAATAAGSTGANFAKYTGLLAPRTESYINLAAAEIKSAQTVFSTINSNSLLAVRNGVWQNTLEALAFEGMVQATMFKSPVLEGQDAWDIAKNMAVGGALGGAIGGTFFTVKAFGQIKAARVAEDIANKPFSSRELVGTASLPSERILLAADNRSNTASPILQALPEGASVLDIQLAEVQFKNAQQFVKDKSKKIDLDIRTAMHEMDATVNTKSTNHVNAFADTLEGVDVNRAVSIFAHAKEISHPNVTTKLETSANKLEILPVQTRYYTIAGDGAGNINWTRPAVLDVADLIVPTKGSGVEDAIRTEIKASKFNFKALHDPLAGSAKTSSYKIEQLRNIWIHEQSVIPKDLLMHGNDVAFLERMVKDGRTDFTLTFGKPKDSISFSTVAEVKDYLKTKKLELADDIISTRINDSMAVDKVESSISAIAKTLNIDPAYLRGDVKNLDDQLMYWQSQTSAKIKKAQELGKDISEIKPTYFDPKVVKVNYQIPKEIEANAQIADHLAYVKTQQKIYQQEADMVFERQAGAEFSDRTIDIASKLDKTNSFGAGAGFLRSAQGAYGSPEAAVQYLGTVTKDMEISFKKKVTDALTDSLFALKNNKAASIEWSALQQKLSRTPDQYVFDTEGVAGLGSNVIVNKKVLQAIRKEGNLDELRISSGAEEFIKINNPETFAALQAHTALTKQATLNSKEVYAALGKTHVYDADIIRPIRPNPKDYPHFAFVDDPKVTGSGRTTMLFANTEVELNALINKTKQDFPDFRIRTKQDGDDYFKAQKVYEYDLGLNENYLDSSMKSKGIYSNFYTQTDSQKIVDDILSSHLRSAEKQAHDLMRMKYNSEFTWLEKQADEFSRIESSKFGSSKIERVKQEEKNPYISYIKTALAVSSSEKNGIWKSTNTFLDESFSKAVGKVNRLWDSSKSADDLVEVNKLLDEYGINTAFKSSAEAAFVNHTAPKNELSKFISKANAVLSRVTLGLDPLNAVNNAIGSNVLRMTELTSVVRGVQSGGSLSGELSALSKIPGFDLETISPTRLVTNALKRSFNKDIVEEYKQAGIIRDRVQQFNLALDDIALSGTETVAELQSRTNKFYSAVRSLADKGEKFTGNAYAEELNRFVSADVMRQMTDVMEKHKGWSRAESMVYWNTFVNRVENSMLASQRPEIFQGPLGQALGLFQSYQFNIIQQVFRYVAEGQKKDIAMFLGMQGTLYGLQGMPGYKFINEHIVGTASGNTEHRDLYDISRGTLGKEAGNFLLYGTASNLLQTNIYTRGDLNPRHLTIIPTSISDVPFISAFSKLTKTIAEAANKTAGGGDLVETWRQAVEHNGISRPLAGLAQVSRAADNDGKVFSVSTKGTIIGENNLMSLATISRLAGGRPLDEAILNETTFSIAAYEAKDREKKKLLAETIKTQTIGKGQVDANEYLNFAEQYAALGGKQSSFNKYMMEQYVKANTSQAQIIFDKLNNPLSYKIQSLMGGQQ